ncbi:hypothetical protein DSUL_60101 [Desulfovibrionales bacterium]
METSPNSINHRYTISYNVTNLRLTTYN